MSLRNLLTPLALLGIVATILYSERVIEAPVKDNRVHITYWEKWTSFEGDAIKDTVDEFNRSQNRIYVDLLTISSIEKKTLLAVAGGDPPDVAGLYGPNVAQYADDNAVMPLDDLCRRSGISRDQYIPIFWDMNVYHGHLYALPTVPACTALHYNKAMFKAAGLDPEKPPQTIEELDAASEKITTKKNGKIDKSGFLAAEPGWWNWCWGYLFGGKLWDGKDKITANSPENVRAYRMDTIVLRQIRRHEPAKFSERPGQLLQPAERLSGWQSGDGDAGRLDVQLHQQVRAATGSP